MVYFGTRFSDPLKLRHRVTLFQIKRACCSTISDHPMFWSQSLLNIKAWNFHSFTLCPKWLCHLGHKGHQKISEYWLIKIWKKTHPALLKSLSTHSLKTSRLYFFVCIFFIFNTRVTKISNPRSSSRKCCKNWLVSDGMTPLLLPILCFHVGWLTRSLKLI